MKKILFGGFLAFALLAVSCNKENSGTAGGDASVVVKIGNTATRAKLPDNITAEQSQAGENALKTFTAYVFNYNTGRLEAKESGDIDSKQVTLEKLNSATPKRIVITANTEIDIALGGTYEEFETLYADLDLEPITYPLQVENNSKGFAMFGEKSPVSLDEGHNEITIEIERLVGKVSIAQIALDVQLDPEADDYLGFTESDIAEFTITGVTMQRVIGQAAFLGTNPGIFYGGIVGDGLVSEEKRNYLYDSGWQTQLENKESKELGNYFYVMPNDGGENGYYTMLTLVADYKGKEVYFPVVVNRSVGSNDKTVGNVENNHWYTIDLKIKDLYGSEGPEIPKGDATVEVTVKVLDWEVVATQYEEW